MNEVAQRRELFTRSASAQGLAIERSGSFAREHIQLGARITRVRGLVVLFLRYRAPLTPPFSSDRRGLAMQMSPTDRSDEMIGPRYRCSDEI